ncbi:hypothetical protein KY284_012924 [Solanum tuberosum]|nr:hypothetical protein KY284_012924 [Solanum tuberosum]
MWKVGRYIKEHTCDMGTCSDGHFNLDVEMIANVLRVDIEKKPRFPIKDCQTAFLKAYGISISRRKAYLGRKRAFEKVYSTWEGSFAELSRFMEALKHFNHGTIVEWKTEWRVDVIEDVFNYVFWTFKPCIDGFVFCRPVISIDGTHAYGKYDIKLLIAIATNGNGSILPLAFAIVVNESMKTCSLFLDHLHLHVVKGRRGVALTLDRHHGILSSNIMKRVVNPGPIDRTLLLSQHEHKSELLWKGEISFSSLMRTMHMNDAWNLFRLHQPHGRVDEILRRSGLYDIVCVGRMQYDCALVTTMVERWRLETHCFHLPFGEVTIILHDVHVLFGLHIDGDVVYMQDAARRIHPWRTLLETLTECAIAPADMDGASQVRIHSITGYLRDQLQVDPIGDATPVERVEKISRLYMLVILGASYFRTRRGTLLAYNTWRF